MTNRKQQHWKRLRADRRRLKRKLKRLQPGRRNSEVRITPLTDERWVFAPRTFALEDPFHEKLAEFLAQIRDAVRKGNKTVCIDFRNTEAMVAGATLLFYSELIRIRQIAPNVPFRCIPAKNATVAQILTHLGIYNLLGYESSVVPTRSDVVTWRAASSHRIDGSAVGRPLSEFALDDVREKHLFRGATEAMVNAINHAYISARDDGLPTPADKNWWMFLRRDDDKLIVAVCDLGIGIPRSLPLKYPAEVVAEAMAVLSGGRRATDSRLIQAAMELQRTRTSRKGRGKGLNDLKRIVDEVPGGKLYIFSNRGLVKYESKTYTRRNFRRSILGTVVVWVIPLGENNDE